MADPIPDGTWGGPDLAAVKVLIAHQRLDIGSCLCGWGVGTGDLGRSHSLHVWRELQRAVLPGHDARVRAAGYDSAVAELRAVHDRTGSPAAGWAADYLSAPSQRTAALHATPPTTTEGADHAR